jgi:hypothetical protein
MPSVHDVMAKGDAHECIVIHAGEEMEKLARCVVNEFENKITSDPCGR